MILKINSSQKVIFLGLALLFLFGAKTAAFTLDIVTTQPSLVMNDSVSIMQQITKDTIVEESNIAEVYRIIKETNLFSQQEIDEETLHSNAPSLMQALNKKLATRFAPIHHQEVDKDGAHALGGKADYITKIDFDKDWEMTNNWENVNAHSNDPTTFTAAVYYSVVWTRTHWYIIYFFFHPRDWSNFLCKDEHENDVEGILLVVPQTTIEEAKVKAMVTVFHKNFYSFTTNDGANEAAFRGNFEDIDGTITFEGQHPRTAQEARGHGILNLKDNEKSDRPGIFSAIKFNQDGRVIYRPIEKAGEVPEWPTDINDKDVKYELVDIFECKGLWAQRNNPATFINNRFRGDRGDNSCMIKNAADPPWNWDDKNDYPNRGVIATNPASLVHNYFSNKGNFDHTYIYNPYAPSLPVDIPVEEILPDNEWTNGDSTQEISANEFNLLVYPNPTMGLITIDLSPTIAVQELRVIDLLGRQVYQNTITAQTQTQIQIDLSLYENGLYYIEWRSREQCITKPILKK